jgi:hypothetical protein
MKRSEAVKRCYQIPGMCWPVELGVLWDLFSGTTRHVEIGTYCGRSLFVTAMSAAEGAEIISVEPLIPVDQNIWPMPSPDWQRASLNATFAAIRYHRPDLVVTHLERTSVDACREFHGVASSIYIDGDHNFAEVLADIQGWKTRLADGGILAGHDYWPTDQGVIEAVHASGFAFEVIANTRIFRMT